MICFNSFGFNKIVLSFPTCRSQEGISSANGVSTGSGSCRKAADAVLMAKRSHMTKAPSGTFHSQNFRAIMGFILENAQPGYKKSATYKILQYLNVPDVLVMFNM